MDFLTSFLSSALANLSTLLFSKKEAPDNSRGKQKGGEIDTGINYGHIEQTTTNNYTEGPKDQAHYKFRDLRNEEIKKLAQVLFIDDQDQTRTIRNLNKLGWQNAHQLEEEHILNTDCQKYRDSDLIFVDFNNVGPLRNGQGLSILNSLMTKYGRKKYYILHTAHPQKITLQKLEESGLPIRENTGWSQLTKGSPDYLVETVMLSGLRQIEK